MENYAINMTLEIPITDLLLAMVLHLSSRGPKPSANSELLDITAKPEATSTRV